MIQTIRLQNFRSYSDTTFTLDEGVTVIVGRNGCGKTNLLESILFAARGHSYRAKDADLIMFNQPWARIDLKLQNNESRTVKIITEPTIKKIYECNEKTYHRLTPQHTLPVVLFEPNHLNLLTGSPDKRRDYLDDFIEQINPTFRNDRRAYKKTLQQRNALLKRQAPQEQFFPWNIRLSQLAGKIVQERNKLISTLNERVEDVYRSISDTKNNLYIEYQSNQDIGVYETSLLKSLEKHFKEELIRGYTLSGPHRDDFKCYIDTRDMCEVASRGEVRTTLLALKTLELELIHAHRNHKPILLLDDVFSELDSVRRKHLTDHIQNYQTCITTTEADILSENFKKSQRYLIQRID